LASGDEEKQGTDAKIKRGVVRTMTNGLLLVISLAVIFGWLYTGLFHLELGEEAIILRLGEHHRTVSREGWNWHWPEPLEYDTPVNTQGLRTEEFGIPKSRVAQVDPESGELGDEGAFIQTADSNIVNVSFELQYTVEDAYSFVYELARPRDILYEATQAAVREVIGRQKVDEVLFRKRHEIEVQAREILEETLSGYAKVGNGRNAFAIDKINLQTVHPPSPVRAAFEDVVAAQQDEERSVSRATGDAREILERARAKASELHEGSEAYKEAKILESRGEAQRFEALLIEYQRAPDVTRRRLYLETMEVVMPQVEKMIVEPDTVGVMPFLQSSAARGRPPAVSAPPAPVQGGAKQ
jgi:membrane protease subunit HflK